MSSVKTIIFVVIGTILLAVVGFGSWYVSTQFIDQPEVTTNTNTTPQEFTSAGKPTAYGVDTYRPFDLKAEKDAEGNVVVKWQTKKSVKTFFFITVNKSEKIQDITASWNTTTTPTASATGEVGISLARSITTVSAEKASTVHSVTLKKAYWESLRDSALNSEKKAYYFIIVNTGEYRIPYGEQSGMTNDKGPAQGYTLDLSKF